MGVILLQKKLKMSLDTLCKIKKIANKKYKRCKKGGNKSTSLIDIGSLIWYFG